PATADRPPSALAVLPWTRSFPSSHSDIVETVSSTPAGLSVPVGTTRSAPGRAERPRRDHRLRQLRRRDQHHPQCDQRPLRDLVGGVQQRWHQDPELHLHPERRQLRDGERSVGAAALQIQRDSTGARRPKVVGPPLLLQLLRGGVTSTIVTCQHAITPPHLGLDGGSGERRVVALSVLPRYHQQLL